MSTQVVQNAHYMQCKNVMPPKVSFRGHDIVVCTEFFGRKNALELR